MTIETKAREWAEKEYKYVENPDNDECCRNWNYKIHDQRSAAERAYIAGAAEAVRWVPVPKEIMQGTYHYLIPLGDKDVYTHWEIITGYADDSGDLCNQHDDQPSGREYKDAAYYMPIAPLPPHPEKEQL